MRCTGAGLLHLSLHDGTSCTQLYVQVHYVEYAHKSIINIHKFAMMITSWKTKEKTDSIQYNESHLQHRVEECNFFLVFNIVYNQFFLYWFRKLLSDSWNSKKWVDYQRYTAWCTYNTLNTIPRASSGNANQNRASKTYVIRSTSLASNHTCICNRC